MPETQPTPAFDRVATASAPARLCIMLSGGGRTMVNIAAQISSGLLPARIVQVIASKPCAGCDRARELGVEPTIIAGSIQADALRAQLSSVGAELVVLAGYLKKVNIPPGYENRVVNIHPALLPAFGGPGMYGHHVHEAVLAHGCKVTGCTVHLCDARYDTGPILAQRACAVLETDTPETLAARVFEQECLAYPEALRALIAGRVGLLGGRAIIRQG